MRSTFVLHLILPLVMRNVAILNSHFVSSSKHSRSGVKAAGGRVIVAVKKSL